MRFERIYVGAGASQRSAEVLFRMLHVGGIIVGLLGPDGSQRLLKAQRISESHFQVKRPRRRTLRNSAQFSETPASPHRCMSRSRCSSRRSSRRWPPSCPSRCTRRRGRRGAPHLLAAGDAVRTVLMAHNRADNRSRLPRSRGPGDLPDDGPRLVRPERQGAPAARLPPAAKQAAARPSASARRTSRRRREGRRRRGGGGGGERRGGDGRRRVRRGGVGGGGGGGGRGGGGGGLRRRCSRRAAGRRRLLRQRSLSRILRRWAPGA